MKSIQEIVERIKKNKRELLPAVFGLLVLGIVGAIMIAIVSRTDKGIKIPQDPQTPASSAQNSEWTGEASTSTDAVVKESKKSIFDRVLEALGGEEKDNGPSLGPLSLISKLSGFETPKTYLVLFLNNTEIRPAGGFIGSYAVVTFDKGKVSVPVVQGSEKVGVGAVKSAFPSAPTALARMNRDTRWYFRDANWSPDFFESALKAHDLYKLQTDDERTFDGVIGITPSLISALLKDTGSLVVQGVEYTAENVLEKIQYEVQVGYLADGKTSGERKDILKELSAALVEKLGTLSADSWKKFWKTGEKLVAEKQFMVALFDGGLQKNIERLGWGGRVILDQPGDYLMVVDANMNSLKSDLVVDKSITYEVEKDPKDGWVAKVTATYKHNGSADWRTTDKYTSYTRIFVPQGAGFLGQKGLTPTGRGTVDVLEENGKTSFGGYFTVNAKSQHPVIVRYKLPPTIVAQLEKGTYKLNVQKQPGALKQSFKATISLPFALRSASPAGVELNGGRTYVFEKTLGSDVSVDLTFGLY